jgi:HAMP domain-containing protein
MNSNGYINATKLCKLENKLFKEWLKNNNSKELIKEVEKDINPAGGIPPAGNKALIEYKSGYTELRGTYIHPLLIPTIASWVSPRFTIKVNKIINDFIVSEYKMSIKEKNTKIKNQSSEIKELNKKIEQMMIEMRSNTQRIINSHKVETDKLNDNINSLKSTIERIADKLQKNGANIPSDEKLQESIVVLSKDNNKITVIRGQQTYINRAIKDKRKDGYKVVEEIEGVASTVGTFNVVKEQLLSESLISIPNRKKYNDIRLVGLTISDLINIIQTINMSCKQV